MTVAVFVVNYWRPLKNFIKNERIATYVALSASEDSDKSE